MGSVEWHTYHGKLVTVPIATHYFAIVKTLGLFQLPAHHIIIFQLHNIILILSPETQTSAFTHELEVMVDDIDNGTNITCQVTGDQRHILINIKGRLYMRSDSYMYLSFEVL